MKRILRSLLTGLFSILTIYLVSRLMIRALPGDPASALLEHMESNIPIEEVRKEYHLDEPWQVALGNDLKSLARGDLGRSLHSRKPIHDELRPRIARTAQLAAPALLLSLFLGTWMGILSARKTRGITVTLIRLYTAVATALPAPWIGPMLAWLLGVKLGWFSPSGSWGLPCVLISIGLSAFWTRLIESRMRAAFSSGIESHALRAARARGLPEWKIILKYGLIPVCPALLAVLGTQAGSLIAGSFVAEVLFDWPGLGSAFVEAVLRRDYPMVEACVFITGAASILGTRLGDLLQKMTDPRYRDAAELREETQA